MVNIDNENFDNVNKNKYLLELKSGKNNINKSDIEMQLIQSEDTIKNEIIKYFKNINRYELATDNNIIFNQLLIDENNLFRNSNVMICDVNDKNRLITKNNNLSDNNINSLLFCFANPIFKIFEDGLNYEYDEMSDEYYTDKKHINQNRPKIKTMRFRHPRINIEKTYLKNYNYSETEITMMLLTLFSKNYIKENNLYIIFTKNLFTYNDDLSESYTSLIITGTRILVINEANYRKFDFSIKEIIDTKIFEIISQNKTVERKFKLVFELKKGISYYLITRDFDSIYEIEKNVEKVKNELDLNIKIKSN